MNRLDAIKQYWNLRAEGYSLQTKHELEEEQEACRADILLRYVDSDRSLSVLDLGCGPGLFSILLAQKGHQVTALDCTENMLERARKNAQNAGVDIRFVHADAQHLPFADENFDLIVTRNLTWNLEHPKRAYREWLRVLKIGGSLVNIDGNHYLYLFDKQYAREHAQRKKDEKHPQEYMMGVDPSPINKIARSLPLSRRHRPQWDIDCLLNMGVSEIGTEVQRRSYSDAEGRKRSIVSHFVIFARKG